METLSAAFHEYIKHVMAFSKASMHITEENVYQEGNDDILIYLDKMADDLLLPGSGIDGLENLEELFAKAEAGKSCLLLPEHYSNFDLTLFSYLVRKAGGRGEAIGRSVIAIAGMKLNEENPIVAAFASAYSRIVIYPSRSLHGMDEEKKKTELARSNAINRAAMKALVRIKNSGRLILLFPSGTRYRPGDPSTKRGVKEVDSYIKLFDYFCPIAINGEVLHIKLKDMMEDEVSRDVVRLTAGPVISCAEFRGKVISGIEANAAPQAVESEGAAPQGIERKDKKQAVADAVMAELERMHIAGGERRKRFLRNQG